MQQIFTFSQEMNLQERNTEKTQSTIQAIRTCLLQYSTPFSKSLLSA